MLLLVRYTATLMRKIKHRYFKDEETKASMHKNIHI